MYYFLAVTLILNMLYTGEAFKKLTFNFRKDWLFFIWLSHMFINIWLVGIFYIDKISI